MPPSPQEKYPEATEVEAELLVSLDGIVADPVVSVELAPIDHVGISTTLQGHDLSVLTQNTTLFRATNPLGLHRSIFQ